MKNLKIIDHVRRHDYQIIDVVPTLDAHMGTGGCNVPMICYEADNCETDAIAFDVYNMKANKEVFKTLNSAATDNDHVPIVCYAVENHPCDGRIKIDESGTVQTLRARMGTGGGNEPMALIVLSSSNSNPTKNDVDVSPPILARAGTGGGNAPIIAKQTNGDRKYILRRLTPTECCRLMGFPDWWVDGVEGSESAKYKMWGNGVGLNCVYWVMKRLAKELQKDGESWKKSPV